MNIMKKNSLQCAADWIMRGTLAVIFITAGYNKLFILGPETFASMVNIPLFLAWCGILGELGAGIGILAGGLFKDKTGTWITKFSGLLMIVIMGTAFGLVKIKGFEKGFLPGLQGMYDIIAITAMSFFYALTGKNSKKT